VTTDTRIATVADPHCTVVVFMQATGGAEVIVTSPDAPRKPTTVIVNPPPKGRRIATVRYPDGCVEVVYRDTE